MPSKYPVLSSYEVVSNNTAAIRFIIGRVYVMRTIKPRIAGLYLTLEPCAI